MKISKVNISNFKCFNGKFTFSLSEGLNILVGNNAVGKSTIIEAIHLALTGVLNGHYLRNEISQYLFNNNVVSNYLKSLRTKTKEEPPEICIEIFIDETETDFLAGTFNSDKEFASGIQYKIMFDDSYKSEYEEFLKSTDKVNGLPVEYYKIQWQDFGRENRTTRTIPIKSSFIDVSSMRTLNGSDIYISRIIQNKLSEKEKVGLSQAYRTMSENFAEEDSVKLINAKLNEEKIMENTVSISADLPTQTAWETALMTYVNSIPFSEIGQGAQSIVKTHLALETNKTQNSDIVLIEEPENHLSHTSLNTLLKLINEKTEKQVLITTHSSFVANKLGLDKLILLTESHKTMRLAELKSDTYDFFKKVPGYPTLRQILCKKAILVEGNSDELIVQKAYMVKNDGKLPIEDGIDVISVIGLSFLRYLEIADLINQKICVITDNDHNYEEKIEKKYKNYWGKKNIGIFADDRNELNTLEPQFVDANANNLDLLRNVIDLDTVYDTKEKIISYMENNKAEWALKIFDSKEVLFFPSYINRAVDWCKNE